MGTTTGEGWVLFMPPVRPSCSLPSVWVLCFAWLSLQDWSLLPGICRDLLFLLLNSPRDADGRHMLSVNENSQLKSSLV